LKLTLKSCVVEARFAIRLTTAVSENWIDRKNAAVVGSLRVEINAVFAQLGAMVKTLLLFLVLSAAVGAGCRRQVQPAAAETVETGAITQAQPKLPTMKIYIGAEEMIAELALTPDQQRAGMMFRTNMAENAAMLFPLPYAQQASFWMKNCPLPLSAAYIDPEGVIQEIHDLQPFNTNTVVAASNNIRFVLETSQGWFARHHINPGMAIATERGSLMQTFFRGR
jgi:uncharacterized membrane protein (UPF0127 family)